MKCKDCLYFNNTIPVDTIKGNDKHKNAEEYIGRCENIKQPKMMNDYCQLFKEKEKQNG